jgi:glycosyltransferase involved in cell wall biosynthesis
VIFFVTPAWQRFELTRVVLAQRRRIIDFLAERDVEARCVVIADDLNADIAESHGFDVLRNRNYALGRRFNDGIQYAAQQGAEWIVPIGSDSFLDPAYLFPLPAEGVMRSSTLYAIAEPGRLGRLRVARSIGVGPYMIPRAYLPTSQRPADEHRKRGIDSSTIRGLKRGWKREWVDLHPWQYVGWRSYPQMNSYDKLYERIGVGQESEVAERLSEHYPSDLVERALLACAARAEVAA